MTATFKEKVHDLYVWLGSEWQPLVIVTLGNIIYAFAIVNFTLPYNFPDLGVSGLAVLSHYLFGLSPVWVVVGANCLLLLWGQRNLSRRFLLLTIYSIIILSLFLTVFSWHPLQLPRDKFMATLISGVLKGLAAGMIFNVGGSGGGTDILAMVMRRRHGVEVGRFSIFINLFILAISMGVVGLEAVVYGAAGLYIYGLTVDNVTSQFDRRKQAFIVTSIPDEVSHFITSRGKDATIFDGRGAYTGHFRAVLISLLEPRQVVQLKRFLQEKDPSAFVSICDASEVIGKGFKSWKSL